MIRYSEHRRSRESTFKTDSEKSTRISHIKAAESWPYLLDDFGEWALDIGPDLNVRPRLRMTKPQCRGRQQQPMAPEMVPEEPVVDAHAVFGVADDGVTEVAHVAAELMAATGPGVEFDQGIAGRGVSVNGVGKFGRGQTPEIGDGGICRISDLTLNMLILDLFQRIIDRAAFIDISPDHGEIGFPDPSRFEQVGCRPGRFRVKGEEQNAGGGFVQAVDRENPLTDRVANHLKRKPGFARGDEAPVDEQPGRFMDGHEMGVPVEDIQVRFGVR